jgi:two-component system nitrogen regulation response regulator GlnG
LSARVLIVDDEEGVRFVLSRAAERVGCEPVAVGSAEDARAELRKRDCFLALIDVRLPGDSGFQLLSELQALPPHERPYAVMMTAQDTVEAAIEAMKRGAEEYLAKPFDMEAVLALVRALRERPRPRAPAPEAAPEDLAEKLVGKSAAMRDVYKEIGRAARTDLTLLVTGESGTGKELVARALHAHSARARGPFVPVNVAAIPRELLESELYGYERGAFTGASERRAGKFETAQGGTLFLDEVGELPLELQAKLLRALQAREVARLGGGAARAVDVRVIAATNADLRRAVAEGRFRADLFYRLSVVELRVPPLRERKEDIRALAEHFIARYAPVLKARATALGDDAARLLEEHPWPGNVREMENVVRAALLRTPGPQLSAADVKPLLVGPPLPGPEQLYDARLRERLAAGEPDLYTRALEEVERVLLSAALDVAGGNQSKAAALLGLHRNSLRRRLAALGMIAAGGEEEP